MRGGGGSKVSETYEDTWNQFTLLDLVVGLAQKMQPEPPGTAGYGFEFWVDRSDRREWHQVKYQRGRIGRWNLNDLDSEGVLTRFRDKLQVEPLAACCFVSSHSATPLDLLCARAGQADTLSRFLDTFVAQAGLGRDFEDLWKVRWNVTAEQAWQWLRSRILVRSLDWTSLQERLSERIRIFIDGDEPVVRQALTECQISELYNEIDRDALIAFLTDRGCPPRAVPSRRAGIAERVADVSREFVRAGNENLISATFLAREAPAALAVLVDRRDPPAAILLVGEEGCGKSAVACKFVEARLAAGGSVLTIDVQALSQQLSTAAVGTHFDLPRAPAESLVLASPDRPAVLVLDALDSVGKNRGRSIQLYSVVDRLIKEAVAHPNITLLMSCRREDYDTDERLRDLVRDINRTETVEVPRLQVEQVRGAIVTAGGDPTELNDQQLELLRLPEMLKIFILSMSAGRAGFSTKEELFQRYLECLDRDEA
jgi:hypothetical protein